MRIGVYLRGLDLAYAGGLKTYAFGLVNGLIGNSRGHQVVLFVAEEVRAELVAQIEAVAQASVVSVRKPAGRLVEQLTVLSGLEPLHVAVRNRRMRSIAEVIAAKCDVVLFPLCFMETYDLRVPSIVSFHDLQHETYPQFFGWRALRNRRVRFGATFRHATLLQASSRAMKADALRIYGERVSTSRIAIIPEGVDYAAFSTLPDADVRPKYGLPAEFLLYPAQLWHHKNHLRVLQALERLRARGGERIPLVLTGAEYEAAPAIRRFSKDRNLDQVFILGKVPYADLRSLYRHATYVLSASLHESNCLPLLEAAASGRPLVVADIPPNRESAQVFKLRLFDPLDIEDIAKVLAEAWAQRHENGEAVELNRQAVRQFDWTVIADTYLQHAERLLAAAGSGPPLEAMTADCQSWS